MHDGVELPLDIHLGPAPQGEVVHPLGLPQVAEHGFDKPPPPPAVEVPAQGRVDPLDHLHQIVLRRARVFAGELHLGELDSALSTH